MARVSIQREGFLELVSSWDGGAKRVRIVSFVGRSDTGDVSGAQFEPDFKPRAIIDLAEQKLRTTEFDTGEDTRGDLTQVDTGPSGHTCWAIYLDTGQV